MQATILISFGFEYIKHKILYTSASVTPPGATTLMKSIVNFMLTSREASISTGEAVIFFCWEILMLDWGLF